MTGDYHDQHYINRTLGHLGCDGPPSAKPTVDERLSRIEEQLRVIADVLRVAQKPSEPIKQSIGECGCQYGPCVHRFWTIGEDVKKRSEPVDQAIAQDTCSCHVTRPMYQNVASVMSGRHASVAHSPTPPGCGCEYQPCRHLAVELRSATA